MIATSTTHWAVKYIGLPFQIGARGPDKFDCWGLVREIYRQEKGVELSEIQGISALDVPATLKAFDTEIKSHWKEIFYPEEFCAVCMGTVGEVFWHVGVGLQLNNEWKILHTREKVNAVLDNVQRLRLRCMTIKKFYRYQGGQNVLAN